MASLSWVKGMSGGGGKKGKGTNLAPGREEKTALPERKKYG